MNSARAFGKFPSDITDIVETYVPGAAAFLPLLYSFAGFNVISYVWQKIILGFAGFFLVSVSIAATDTLCGEVIDWLAVNVINRRGLGAVSLNASKAKQGIFGPTRTLDEVVQYEPAAQSSLWFFRGWRLIYSRRQVIAVDAVQYGLLPEDGQGKTSGIVLTTIGFSPNFLKAFLEECNESAVNKARTITTFYKFSENMERFKPVRRPTRPLRTIDLDLETKGQLVKDIQRYLEPASIRFYATRGIPHRRGYLFHGPPGTGKTSMSVALAGHFQLDLYIINLAAFTNGDSALADTFETIPRKCMVLLEDIDSAGIKRENIRQEEGPHNMLSLQGKGRRAPKPRNPITLSGLLNAIDGATSQEGRVLIMTTNDPEALDDALIRPGRVDMQVFFGPVSQKIAEAIFVRMYTKDSRDSALSTSSVEPSSEQYSLFAKLLSNLRSVSWWRVLVAWIIPPTWAATAVHYHFGFEIIISKLLLGVCIYTTIAMVVLVSLAIYLEKIGPTTNGAATLLNSALRGESPVPSNSSMTSIERSGLREMAGVFGTRIPENRFTPAEVQGFLLMNMEHPDAALANIDGWVARLLAAKDCGTNIIPEEPPLDNALKPIVGQPSTPPNSGNKKNKQLATATQGSDPSDQSVVFLEGSPSSHIFPSATRGYKKLTAYFCYNPKGAATSAEEKQRQQNTVQYFQQASKALEAIDGKEAVPSSRYQLSRRITVSPTRNEADPGPSRLREESLSGEDDEGTDDDSEGGPVLSPGALARLREISRRQAETTAERIRRGGARPANLNFSRVSRAELEDDGDE